METGDAAQVVVGVSSPMPCSQIFMCAGVLALCRCAQVCRSWKDLTEEPQLWNKVDFYSLSYR